MIKLKEAVKEYQKEKSSCTNSYDWFRKSAKQNGYVCFGDEKLITTKNKNIWFVNNQELSICLEKIRRKQNIIHKNTIDFSNNILHGKNGEKIEVDWGYYINYTDFIFVFNKIDYFRRKNEGYWSCKKCNSKANLLQNNIIFCQSCNIKISI